MSDKISLYGFNNLTKSLSFNIYDVCYAKSQREQKDYIAYIDRQYNSERLTKILTNVTDMIGATVLNISSQDYEPQGSSVTILIAEESMIPAGETTVAHLDKSHITVHTYPEYHPETCLATFRVDIDVATCGEITPLSTLDYLIGSFDSDIITMDYRVRGFTRDVSGQKLFMDHHMTSIQDFIDSATLRRYDAVDINVYEANLFHTKMLVKEIDLQNYLFMQYPKALLFPEEYDAREGFCAIRCAAMHAPVVKKTASMPVTILLLEKGAAVLQLIWYRMPYIRNQIQPGKQYIFYGKIHKKG